MTEPSGGMSFSVKAEKV